MLCEALRLLRPGILALLAAPFLATTAPAQFTETVSPIHTWDGTNPGDGWGVVRWLGDLDGDGSSDFGVGVANNNDNAPNAGKVFIFSGATGDTIRTHVKPGGNHFGFSLCTVGDVDGDDVPDYVVTAPRTLNFFTFNPPGFGRAFLYSGATGMQFHSWRGDNLGAGSQEGFGAWCAGLGPATDGFSGDVDGDGVPDILLAANIFDGGPSPPFSGRVWIFSGANPDSALHILDGDATAGLFGWGGGGIGDIDHDGFADFVIGAPDAGPGNRGRAFVYSGQTGTQFAFSPLEPDTTGTRFGFLFVNGPGDLNGDGTTDILVSDFLDGTLGPSTGKIYTYSGVDGSLLYTVGGAAAGDLFGAAFGCGDVNFDGNDDLVVGSFGNSEGAPTAGRMFVLSGPDGSTLRTMTATTEADGFGTSAHPAFDVNGDAALDFVTSAPGHDTAGADAGRVYVIAGDIFPPVDAPEVAESATAFGILAARPNPSRGESEILFRLPASGRARVTVHDVAGRLVAELRDFAAGAGLHSVSWNGRDADGDAVAPGVYWARLVAGPIDEATRIVRAR